MSKIITTFESKIYLELTEGEAMALDAICGYGPEKFLEWFKKNHGKHYIEPYEKHVKSLFDKARSLEGAVEQFKEARKALREINV
jgi:hypothetical protein